MSSAILSKTAVAKAKKMFLFQKSVVMQRHNDSFKFKLINDFICWFINKQTLIKNAGTIRAAYYKSFFQNLFVLSKIFSSSILSKQIV